jgi:hypothetical protein
LSEQKDAMTFSENLAIWIKTSLKAEKFIKRNRTKIEYENLGIEEWELLS